MKSEPIQDYILKSEHNLRIAEAVGEAWTEARKKLVSGFLDRLDLRVKKKLKRWESGPWNGRFFVDRWAGYYFWKPAWEDQYGLGLQCNEYGKRMLFGVYREKDSIGKRPLSVELLNAIAKLYPSASANSWWEAKVMMQSPAADWQKPEVLWRMHKDKNFLDDVAEQILGVARVSESIIDRLARKK